MKKFIWKVSAGIGLALLIWGNYLLWRAEAIAALIMFIGFIFVLLSIFIENHEKI